MSASFVASASAACAAAVVGAAAVARTARSGSPAAVGWMLSPVAAAGRAQGILRALSRSARSDAVDGRGAVEVLRLRASIAAGASLLQAFEALHGAGGAWAEAAGDVVGRVRGGEALHASIDAWSGASGDPSVALLADSLAIAHRTGGSQVRALDAALSTLRDRDALHREVRALASQARASAVVLVITPVAFAVAVGALDSRVRAVFASPLGIGCLAIGFALDAVGAWWMARLVARVA